MEALQRYMAAVLVTTAVTRSRSCSNTSALNARMVPDSCTLSGTMLAAPSPASSDAGSD